MCSAYRNTDGSWVVVAINYADTARPFGIALGGRKAASWAMYRTSDISAESLAPIGTTLGSTELAPRSVTTFVCQPGSSPQQ